MLDNRIIFSDNGVLSDATVQLNNFYSETKAFTVVALEDYIFLGSTLPFNHRYFNVSTANSAASQISIQLWDGDEWKEAVDIIDQTLDTASGTKTMNRSDILSWNLNKDDGWLSDDTDLMVGSGLTSVEIYGLYWARIKFSANLSFTLKYLGWKFAEDEDLGGVYPDLNTSDVKTQFQSGKTTWEEQHLEAANIIIRDLKNMNAINNFISANQIIRWNLLREASVHKLAEIIFNSHGKDGLENKESARKYYKEALNLAVLEFDRNKNINLDDREKTAVVRQLTR